MNQRTKWFSSIVVLCTCPVIFALPLSYQFTDIGQLFSGNSYARGINNLGQVVGNYKDSKGKDRAFLWDSITGVRELGPGIAKSINDRGEVIIQNGSTAYHWYNGTTNEMKSLGAGGDIYKINNQGQVVGVDYEGGNSIMKGFVWKDGITTYIGSLGGPSVSSNAVSINDYGTVVGWSSLTGPQEHLIYWGDGAMYDMGFYYDDLDKHSTFMDINNEGIALAIVIDTTRISSVKYESYWGVGQPPEYIGPVHAYALNDLGVVVGEDTVVHKAFVWDVIEGKRFLKDMIDPPYPYGLHFAYDINNYGQIVGSTGLSAYLLTPIPEPATSLTLLMGLLCLKRYRGR
jgi:probable HAF family extracellular repeat protein